MAAKLTADQIARVAYAAGFRGEALIQMVAIAYPESGGNPNAHNPNAGTGDNSYGLWQINMLGSMGPARRKTFGIQNNEQLFDPFTNAKAAYEIWRSQGFGAWSAWRHGRHKGFLDEARQAVTNLDPNAAIPKGAPQEQEEEFPDLPDNEADESIIDLPSHEEIRDLFMELFGREPSEEEIAELQGKTAAEDRSILLGDEEALDFNLANSAMTIREKFSGN